MRGKNRLPSLDTDQTLGVYQTEITEDIIVEATRMWVTYTYLLKRFDL